MSLPPSDPTEPYLPSHMRDAMEKYLSFGIEPGSFLYSVLTNDLRGAIGRADHINLRYLTNIVSYCYNNIPSNAWGSEKRVQDWMKHFDELEKAKQP
jgi:hypothetical protein